MVAFSEQTIMQVATGIVFHPEDKNTVLIALRPPHVPFGNLWEFPGGKVESGEPMQAALHRELKEEVGINVMTATPWLSVQCPSAVRPLEQIRLEVWQVHYFTGTAHGREGQSIRWVPIASLHDYDFPEANQTMLQALQ